MKCIAFIMIASIVLTFPSLAMARGHGGSHSRSSHSSGGHNSNYAEGVQRDSNGKIARSAAAKDEFKKESPCPATHCSGYVIDHIDPLKRGGADAPSNMQWQTTADAKAKDKVE